MHGYWPYNKDQDWTDRIKEAQRKYRHALIQRYVLLGGAALIGAWLVGTYIGYVSVIF